ncbi:MAG: flagellar hook-basal body complex protein FliE [Proteobacteria bacterium]|nr:flagellar hook-basal body complex protein FliE [Pseudomonadota bacterium]
MNRIDNNGIQEMLAQIKSMAAQANPAKAAGGGLGYENVEGGTVDFADVLKSALGQVDAAQKKAHNLERRFALGDNSVNISDVMIEGQKANIAMQATLRVRDRLVSAYSTIMNMGI